MSSNLAVSQEDSSVGTATRLRYELGYLKLLENEKEVLLLEANGVLHAGAAIVEDAMILRKAESDKRIKAEKQLGTLKENNKTLQKQLSVMKIAKESLVRTLGEREDQVKSLEKKIETLTEKKGGGLGTIQSEKTPH